MTNNIFLKLLLSPIAFLYFLATWIRNKLFDIQIFKSFTPNVFTVCVGNLSVGGTGKTPMVEYIVNHFSESSTAVLSRGYGRKTKGFIAADVADNAATIGDEPYQYWLKYGKIISIFVGENRVKAFEKIIKIKPDLKLLLLDDAFQHRAIKAHLNIVLIDYNNLIDKDWIMPIGTLREDPTGLNRAEVIIVSKCPENLTEAENETIKKRISKYLNRNIPILFSAIQYAIPIQFNGEINQIADDIVIASAIANPAQFEKYCNQNWHVIRSFTFSDHHFYTEKDIHQLEKSIVNNSAVLLTEKDYVKLFGKFQPDIKAYYLPIKVAFLFEGEPEFSAIFQKYKSTF